MAQKRPPRVPPGYSALAVEPSQILLQLTISNKCGQAFRWRGVDVYEPYDDVKSEEEAQGLHTLSNVKRERDEGDERASVFVKREDADDRQAPIFTEPIETDSHKMLYRRVTEWSLCLSDRVVFVRQDEERGYIYHRTLLGSNVSLETQAHSDAYIAATTAAWLRDYLNLDVPLEAMYEDWSAKDPVFKRFATRFAGLRMLRQDPTECLFAFICSSNNNIARIGQMVQSLCTNYAAPIATMTYPPPPKGIADDNDDVISAPLTIAYHPFPDVSRLAHDDVEANLRKLMFGYRAKFIQDTARRLLDIVASSQDDSHNHEEGKDEKTESSNTLSGRPYQDVSAYLFTLRSMTYTDARQQLLQFNGVGPKVADCILLMSMDQPSSIPVDRHVFQFAEKWYRIRTKGGHKGYEHIADTFRQLWGQYAGWAHSVLFTADLRAFQTFKVEAKEEEEGRRESAVKDEPVALRVKQESTADNGIESQAAPGILPGASQYMPSATAVGVVEKEQDAVGGLLVAREAQISARDARRQRRLERVEDLSRTSRPGPGTKANGHRKRSLLAEVRPENGGIKEDFAPRKVSRHRQRAGNIDSAANPKDV